MDGKSPRAYKRLLTWGYSKYGSTWAIFQDNTTERSCWNGKESSRQKIKSDAPSHCLWLLISLRFVNLLWYGDPKSLWINCWVFVYELSGRRVRIPLLSLKTSDMALASKKEFLNIQANYRMWIHSEARTWHDNNIQSVLRMLDKKMIAEGRKILLLLDNTPFHSDILQEGLKNIKKEFLPTNHGYSPVMLA